MDDVDFIGLSIQDAYECCQAHGIVCRVEINDNQPRALTDDLDPHRLNFTVEGGKIVSVRRG